MLWTSHGMPVLAPKAQPSTASSDGARRRLALFHPRFSRLLIVSTDPVQTRSNFWQKETQRWWTSRACAGPSPKGPPCCCPRCPLQLPRSRILATHDCVVTCQFLVERTQRDRSIDLTQGSGVLSG